MALGGVMLACLILASGAAYWLTEGETVPAYQIGGPFTLLDSHGKTVTDRDFRGKYLLVYFGYTFCPDACPTTLTQVADALDRLGGKADRLTPVFITVDPKRDTPAVVGTYAAAFSPRLVGLTGDSGEIAAVAKEYHVYYAVHGSGADYTVDHSSILYLMGPDGKFVALIPADAGAPTIAAALAKYLS
jgi:protein SCO1/2